MDNTKTKNNKEGLIPVTCKILKNLTGEENLEYLGIPVGEICLVGFATKYYEQDSKITIGIWDQSGYFEFNFYDKNEAQTNYGVDGYDYIENGVVKVVGKIKYNKGTKVFNGAKIMNTTFNEFVYHKLEVISDWMYLTNELNDGNEIHFKDVKKGNNNVSNIGNVQRNEQNERVKAKVLSLINLNGQTTVEEVASELEAPVRETEEIIKKLHTNGDIFFEPSSKQIYNI